MSDSETYYNNVNEALLDSFQEAPETLEEDSDINEGVKITPEEWAEYNRKMEALNKKHSVVWVGSECCVMTEFFDPVKHKKDIMFSSFQTFKNWYLNQPCPNIYRGERGAKIRDVGTLWLQSKRRRKYDRVVFDPSCKVNENIYFNLFRGFPVQPKEGSWNLLEWHLYHIICGGDDDIFNYMMGWMARMIQEPGGERPGTAIVLKGIQGCGKGCLANTLGRIMGYHYRHILQISHLTGRFNSQLKDAIFVFCDEITWGGDKQAEGILKGLITEPTIPIEHKGRDSMEIDSHVNLMIASNNDWIIPAGIEERRFCVLNVKPDKAGDREYFNALFHQLKNGGTAAFMYELMNWDYSDTDLRTIPRTRELLEQIISTMNPVHKYWYEILTAGGELYGTEWELGEFMINSDDVYNDYIRFCEKLGGSYRLMKHQFARKLAEICPGLKRIYPRDSTTGRQVLHYVFPDMKACRNDFEKCTRLKADWPDESEPADLPHE